MPISSLYKKIFAVTTIIQDCDRALENSSRASTLIVKNIKKTKKAAILRRNIIIDLIVGEIKKQVEVDVATEKENRPPKVINPTPELKKIRLEINNNIKDILRRGCRDIEKTKKSHFEYIKIFERIVRRVPDADIDQALRCMQKKPGCEWKDIMWVKKYNDRKPIGGDPIHFNGGESSDESGDGGVNCTRPHVDSGDDKPGPNDVK